MRRFLVSLVLWLGFVSMGFVSPGGAVAQEATPMATEPHPIIGAWEVRTTSEQFAGLLFAIFTADGVYLQVEYVPAGETRSPVGVGTWTATDDGTVEAMYWVLQDEEGTHVMVWLTLKVIMGSSMSGTIATLIMDPLGGISEQATATVRGTKLTTEPNLVE